MTEADTAAMVLVRPATTDDLDNLLELVNLAGGEITTLTHDRQSLARRLEESRFAFSQSQDRPGGQTFVLVLEVDGRLVGTASVQSKTGGFDPFYSYEVRDERYQSDALGVDRVVKSLHLAEDHSGPAELGGLFLHPEARGKGLGRVLTVARLLFAASRPAAFDERLVAEVRGVVDPDGDSPFWNAVGRHFFGVTFREADHLSVREKKIIADLMPDHPIYIDMLPKAAQQVIGVEHPDAAPARRVLEAEGFTFDNRVDIFDAGPALECRLADCRVSKEMRQVEVASIAAPPEPTRQVLAVIADGQFQATAASDAAALTTSQAKVLDVRINDVVLAVSLKPSPNVDPAAGGYADGDVSSGQRRG